MSTILAHQGRRQRAILLLVIAITLIMLWQTALGSLLLYPLTILATSFHEMGTASPRCSPARGSNGCMKLPHNFARN